MVGFMFNSPRVFSSSFVFTLPHLRGCLRRRQRRLQFAGLPSAAEGLDELHGRGEALAAELGAATLGLEGFAVGVHDFEVAHDAGAVTLAREFGGATGVGHGAVLRGGLLAEMANAREAVLHVTERDKDALAIISDTLFVSRFRALVVR